MTTSQHLDKSPPLRRWRAIFRRAAPAPGADDARALAAANRRILQLEMDLAAMRQRRDRNVGACTRPCRHAALLEEAKASHLKLQFDHAEVHHRMREMLEQLQDLNTARPDQGPAAGPELPQ